MGEGSIALAKALGIDRDPKSGGADDGIYYVIFPQSGEGNGYLPDNNKIKKETEKRFEAMGGSKVIK